ncbi:MAG: hypothetical protein LBR76_08285 [Oscillospiraceae bacterium]|nr:hypothetical protein [Oscillospiraceae bacterium]
MDSFVTGNELMSQMLGGVGSLTDAFIALLNCIMALIISVPLIGCVNRLRGEEKRGRIEPVLAAAVPRVSLFGGFVFIAALEAVVFTLLGAAGLYAAGASTGLVSLPALLSAAVVYIPALLVMVGLAAFLVGCAPKLTALIWAVFGYAFLMFYFGRIFNTPEWALKLSPFGSVPQVPLEDVSAVPLTILFILAVALCAAGFAGYGRRDVGQ